METKGPGQTGNRQTGRRKQPWPGLVALCGLWAPLHQAGLTSTAPPPTAVASEPGGGSCPSPHRVRSDWAGGGFDVAARCGSPWAWAVWDECSRPSRPAWPHTATAQCPSPGGPGTSSAQ